MRSHLLVCLLASGCDGVFGLNGGGPTPGDGQVSRDAGDDGSLGMLTCPALGADLVFDASIILAFDQHCPAYHVTPTLAVGLCDTGMGETIAVGALDEVLPETDGLPWGSKLATGMLDIVRNPVLSPDGLHVYVQEFHSETGSTKESVWRYTDTTTGWMGPDLSAIPGSAEQQLLDVTADADVERLLFLDAVGTVTEWAVTLDLLAGMRVYQPNDLGVDAVTDLTMTSDGLRAVIVGQVAGVTGMFYTDRPSVTDAFSAVRPIAGTPVLTHPDLSDDCTRLYTQLTSSIGYIQQKR